jgi:hypothetical protein
MIVFMLHTEPLLFTLLLMSIAVCGGFTISRINSFPRARIIAWIFVLANTIAIERICCDEPVGFRMLAIIAILLYSIKSIVCVEAYARGRVRLTFSAWLVFTLFWFGMNPRIFVEPFNKPFADSRKIFFVGLLNFLVGALLILIAKFIVAHFSIGFSEKIICTLLLLIGLSFMLHFGLLNMSTGILRHKGVNAHKLFNAPIRSASLTEFWGRRWNIAFSEMASQLIYRPLRDPLGKTTAVICAFLLSGLLHEVAISLPVKAGFGLPMLYFALQAVLMQVEQKLEKAKMAINKKRWIGRCWAMFWLIVPAPLLFHPYFLKGVIWPIIGLK